MRLYFLPSSTIDRKEYLPFLCQYFDQAYLRLQDQLLPPNATMPESTSTSLFHTPNKHLLYDATTQKLSFVTEAELIELRKSKILWTMFTPKGSRTMDVFLGFSHSRFVGTIELPEKVFWGRFFGWWEFLYVVEGAQDV